MITTAQETAYGAISQEPEMHGPPMYFTEDWDAARRSVRKLARLAPGLIVPGHGRAMVGEQTRRALEELAADFDRIAVPRGSDTSASEDDWAERVWAWRPAMP